MLRKELRPSAPCNRYITYCFLRRPGAHWRRLALLRPFVTVLLDCSSSRELSRTDSRSLMGFKEEFLKTASRKLQISRLVCPWIQLNLRMSSLGVSYFEASPSLSYGNRGDDVRKASYICPGRRPASPKVSKNITVILNIWNWYHHFTLKCNSLQNFISSYTFRAMDTNWRVTWNWNGLMTGTMFQSFTVIAFSFRFEYLLKLCSVIGPILETRKSSLLKSKTWQNAELATFKQYAYSSNFRSFPSSRWCKSMRKEFNSR